MLDIFVTGDVERISPDAPVPRRDKLTAGGTGNVAGNIALWAAHQFSSARSKTTRNADRLALLRSAGVKVEPVVTPGRMTISKTRVTGGSHHLLRIDREDSSTIPPKVEDEVLARL
jgi:D-beta-D-heptose 7-phosphate kinase/D-beta-D-heptose 1-phosphate adenosyltransferase